MKVLLVVIDGASPRVFCPAVQTGRLKHLNRLADAGGMHQSSISIFPSITPAATAAIITGAYPAEHGIVGASWYDEERGQVVYYGDDFWVIAQKGFGAFLRDFLVHLNGDRLTAPTLCELVEESGADAACLNSADYPNPFERIAGALDARNSGDLWLTARPGCEFEVPGGKPHVGGGSHGALHALDSLSPLIATGPIRLPRALRSVDVAPLCMEALGLPMRYAVGAPRQGKD